MVTVSVFKDLLIRGFATYPLPGLCLKVFLTDQMKILLLKKVLFSINLDKLGRNLRV